jgi:GntR family transcriptional regulator
MRLPSNTSHGDRFIDRSSYEPAYMQLVNIIRRQVASGEFSPGARLPSESQFCETYQVSPMTVRRAINMLVDRGVVTTARGKGTFVKSLDLSTSSFNLANLQKLFRDPTATTVRLLGVELIRADEEIGAKLSLEPGKRVIYISRLISNDQGPVILHKEYLRYNPVRPIVESEMEVTKLMGLLECRGESDFKKGKFLIEAAILRGQEAELLGTPDLFPAFRLEHTFFGYDDVTVSWGWFLARADKLRFTAEVGIWD